MYSFKSFLITILLCICVIKIHAEDNYKVIEGILDLRGQNIEQIKEVAFTGEWEFYWNQLYNPSDFAKHRSDSITYIHVPSLWNNFEINGVKLPATGVATYRMQVLLSYIPAEMAIKLGSIGTAFKLFVDGREVFKGGEVGLNENEAIPAYLPGVVVFTPTRDTLEIIIQVSNFHYSKAGLWSNIYSLGSAKHLLNSWNREIQMSLLLIGSILIFALYHFGLYLLNRNFRYTLYFSLFCLVIVCRILVIGEIFILNIFPNFSWLALVRIEYLTLTLGTLTFSLFIYKFFVEEYSRKFLYFIILSSVLFSVFVIIYPPAVFTKYLIYIQLNILVASSYIIAVVIRALNLKKQSSLTFLIGFSILLLTIINDILYSNRLIYTQYLTSYGFIIFVFSQGYMLSVRFASLLVSTEMLTKKLEKTNQNLEKTVVERTSKIQEQNTQLQEQSQTIILSNNELEKQNDKIKIQRDVLQRNNELTIKQKKQITSSIEYASRIQEAVLNFETEIHSESPDNFVLFHPKEIVSGDFYWFKEVSLVSKKIKIIAVVDCTGHGVPGAFMSILGAMFLNKIVAQLNSETKACDVLNKMRNELKNLLSQHSAPSSLKDGMDMALCIIDYTDMKIQYAGACNPIYVIRKSQSALTTEVEEYKGDNMPIGVFLEKQASFSNHVIDASKGDLIYLFTDGFYNQFGGESGKKLKRKLFKEILLKNSHLPMNKQKFELNQFLSNWRGGFEQIDDITIVGIRV